MLNVGVDVWQFTPILAIHAMSKLTDRPEEAVNKLEEAVRR
jgi:hypothetical protein